MPDNPANSRAAPGSNPPEIGRGTATYEALLVEAAWLYYHDEVNQSEIASRLGLSRASVVNYLAETRARGWVKLYLDSEVFRGNRLARDLCAVYGLKDALVVADLPDDSTGGAARVTRAAADWLPDLLLPGDRLGVSWGETVYHVAQGVPQHLIEDMTVVQLLGSRPASLGFAAETCTTILAQQLGAHCVNLHVPLLLSQKSIRDQLRAEPVVAEQLKAVAETNKTIFACGTCDDDAHIVRTGLIDVDELEQCRARGAVGVICGRLIDGNGMAVTTQMEDRMIGVSLAQMRNKEMALLVAVGAGRAIPARAAILGGYVTHIATSASIAQALLSNPPGKDETTT